MHPALHSFATCLLALAAASASAQAVRLYGVHETVDPQEVARILEQRPAPGPKMRSIRLLDDAPVQVAVRDTGAAGDAGTAAAADAPGQAPAAALALPVQFAFDSADLLPAARAQLDALAQGIRLLPPAQAVVIEGHTDAVGSDAYNDRLSRRRAQAVRSYLVAEHRIDAARLRAVGLGPQAPLPGRDPRAAENRRVQFRGE